MERRYDKALRERVVKESAAGRSIRNNRNERQAKRRETVRLVCGKCRRRIDKFRDPELFYGKQWGREPDSRRTHRCACGGSYPVTLERLAAEYAAAIERGDMVIELPLTAHPD